MTVPVGAFPTQFGGGTIMDPMGNGGAVAGGLAEVLAQMQQQRENQFRMQELQNQMAQQAALQRYYEEQTRIQQETENRLAGESLLERQTRAEAGSAVRKYLEGQPGVVSPLGGGGMAQQPGATTSASTVPPYNGNMFRELTQGAAQAVGGPAGLAPVFGGVRDENMTSAIGAVEKAQALQPKPPELPTSAKEMQFLQHLAQSDPVAAQFFYENWVKKQPGVVVNNNMGKTETAFGVETAKLDAGRNADIFKDANNAAASIPSMREAYKLVPRTITGFGANQALWVNRLLGRMGVQVSKDIASDSQQMIKLLRDQTLSLLQTRALGSGTAVSEKDREFMERQSAADLTLEPTAIKKIIRINMGLALERMVSTKMELQTQQQTYTDPMARKQIQAKIDIIDRKLADPWTEYWKVLSEEQKEEAKTMLDTAPLGQQLFGPRQ